MPQKKVTMPMQTRSAAVTPSSINEEERTIEVVWTTGAKVERWGYMEELEISDEAIDMTRLRNGAPFLDSHDSWGTDAVVGVVEDAKIENGQGTAKIRFLKDDEVADKIWNKVKQGVLRAVSVGYSVQKYIEEIIDGVRNLKAIKWTPLELSIVAVPADAGASVRSNEKKSECLIESRESKKERKMPKNLKKRSEAEIEEIVTEEKDKIQEVVDEAKDKIEEIQAEAEEKIAEAAGDDMPAVTEDDELRADGEDDDDKEDKEKEGVDEARKAKRALEILDICALAGVDAKSARSFIKQGKSPKQVREHLINKRAEGFERSATVSTNQPTARKATSLAERAAAKYKK